MRRLLIIFLLAAAASVVGAMVSIGAQATLPDCDPDNGGITLPDGFCAMVVADNLGAARHVEVAPNGDPVCRHPQSGEHPGRHHRSARHRW